MRANDMANFRLRRRRQRKLGQRDSRCLAAIGDTMAMMRVPTLDWPSNLFADEPLTVDDCETDDIMVVWYANLARGNTQAGIMP
jgi:hypothetical protein